MTVGSGRGGRLGVRRQPVHSRPQPGCDRRRWHNGCLPLASLLARRQSWRRREPPAKWFFDGVTLFRDDAARWPRKPFVVREPSAQCTLDSEYACIAKQ